MDEQGFSELLANANTTHSPAVYGEFKVIQNMHYTCMNFSLPCISFMSVVLVEPPQFFLKLHGNVVCMYQPAPN